MVFRDLLGRESWSSAWRDLLVCYRRLELQGEIRGGRFVSGFIGEQFALPEAVESLRAMRKRGYGCQQEIKISAADPLNLAGRNPAGSPHCGGAVELRRVSRRYRRSYGDGRETNDRQTVIGHRGWANRR